MFRGTGTTGRRSIFNCHAREADTCSAERVCKWIGLPIALVLLGFFLKEAEKLLLPVV